MDYDSFYSFCQLNLKGGGTTNIANFSHMELSIGVDIGGSHITCALINLEKKEIIRETLTEMPVDNQGGLVAGR